MANPAIDLTSSTPLGTILVVDDHEGVRLVVDQILSSEGYVVLPADCADTALDLCRQHGDEIDLLLTDLTMPRMVGTDLARMVAAQIDGVRVLYMSGDSSAVLSPAEREYTRDYLLQKPFEPDDLLDKVHELLDEPRR
jgi:DNA-binding NtrC family response regulator